MMPPLPLLEKPTKQELPQPLLTVVTRTTTQQLTRRMTEGKRCEHASLDRDIRPSVESALRQVFYAETEAPDRVVVALASIQRNETNDQAAEFFRLFEIHQMIGIGQNHAAGTVDPRFDHPSVRVDIGNVGIAREQQGRNANLMQAR